MFCSLKCDNTFIAFIVISLRLIKVNEINRIYCDVIDKQVIGDYNVGANDNYYQ